MAGVAASILAFFIYLTSRLATPEMSLLYGDLDSQDSGQIVAMLEQQKIPYKLGPNGTQIFVPGNQVGRLRLSMAEQGLPNGGSIGYEIFDRSDGLGTTNFVQNVNHLRALEGELARTIQSIGDVKRARVHLVMPKRELFSRDRQEPSASIVVMMDGNRRFDRHQVAAIQHLVAAAVPGLKPRMISIVDNQGSLLARGNDDQSAEASANTAEEMRAAYERRITRTVEELIERSVGPGNVRAEVRIDMDFDRVTENAEIYDPDGQVVRSTQTVEETADNQEGGEADAVTVGNNLPDAELGGLDDGGTQSRTARTEETVNYEISKTVRTHVRESGEVQKISVAVLVNGSYIENEDGDVIYQERSPQELEKLTALVRTAVGYDEARGDSIEVVNMRFFDLEDQVETTAGPLVMGFTQAEVMRIVELLVLGVVAILMLLFVVRPLIVRVLEMPKRKPAKSGDQFGLLPDPTGAHPMLAAPDFESASLMPQAVGDVGDVPSGPPKNAENSDALGKKIDMSRMEGEVRASSVKKISEIVEQHPEEVVGLLRQWIYQET